MDPLAEILQLVKAQPYQRLGQLLSNAVAVHLLMRKGEESSIGNSDFLFYVTDQDLVKILKEYSRHLVK